MLFAVILIALIAYGGYKAFFRPKFDSDFDDEEVILTKRCSNCGCVNMKNAKICKRCGADI